MPAVVNDVPLANDFCQRLSATMGYLLDRALFCLTAFLASVSSIQNIGWEIRPAASQNYLLGLGEFESTLAGTDELELSVDFTGIGDITGFVTFLKKHPTTYE
jgi:hypothetical protein